VNIEDAKKLCNPEHLMVQTTSRCNLACVICPWPATAGTQSQGEMSDAIYARVVEQARDNPKLSRIMLYLMNEPLMDAKIGDRIDMMRAACPEAEIYIVTNGILINRDLGERLIDSGLSWIGLSVHAIESDTYRAVTGRKDFDEIIKRLDAFVDRAMAARGADFVQVNITRARPHVGEKEYERAADHWRQLGVRRIDLDDGYISRAGNVEVYGHDPVVTRRTQGCKTVWAYKMAHVLYNGDVVACCMDWRRKAVFGNVGDTGGLRGVWMGEKRREFLDLLGSGRELPPGFLCIGCEDAIASEDAVVADVPDETCEESPESEARDGAALESSEADRKEPACTKEDSETPDILLFNPPPWLVNAPPLGLASIAAYLRNRGRRVTVLDGNIRTYLAADPARRNLWQWERGEFWDSYASVEDEFGDILRQMAAETIQSGARVVGVNVVSHKEVATAIFVKELHRLNPDLPIFFGGPHAGHIELRKHIRSLCGQFIEGFIVGEGEFATEELLRRLDAGEKPGGMPGLARYEIESGEEIFEPGEIIENLDDLPFPDFDDYDMSSYESPALMIEWSRGCVGRCTFCNINDFWIKHRFKSPERVLKELLFLTDRYGLNVFNIVDPMVNGDPEVLGKICDLIIESGMEIRWSAGISPNRPVGTPLMEKMKRAGCYRLEFGVESGSDAVLKAMGKSYPSKRAAQMLRSAHDAGIMVVAYLIIGFPGESQVPFENTLSFITDNADSIDLVRSVNGLVLIHGTALERKPQSFGIDEIDRLQPDWTTRWRAQDNTPELRAARVTRVHRLLQDLGIAVEFENIDDVMPARQLFEKKIDEAEQRLDVVSSELNDLIGRIDKVLRGEPVREVAGHDQTALVICPVWGVDAPPLGLAMVAGFLRNQGYAPAIFDFNIECFNSSPAPMKKFFEEDSFRHWTDEATCPRIVAAFHQQIESLVDRLVESGRKVVAFSVYSPNRLFTIEVMRRLRLRRRDIIIIAGGCGVHTVNERLLFPPQLVDYFVVGEGETTIIPLLEDIFSGRSARGIPGVDCFDGVNLAGLRPRPLLQDLSLLAAPAFDLFDLAQYRGDELPLQFSRGCVSHCTFCNDTKRATGHRSRPGAHMAAEIAKHVSETGVKSFRFNDLLVNGDPVALEDLCDELIRLDLGIKWIALFQPRGDMSDELLHKMAAAGCYTVNMGVESGSDNVLKLMGKGFRVSDMEKVLRQTRSAGINTMLNFIVGFPGETPSDARETMEFVRRNREWICGITSVNSCILLEGSALEKNAAKLGIVSDEARTRDVNWIKDDNTPDLRQKRLKDFIAFIESLDIPICVSNIEERAADITQLPEALAPVPLNLEEAQAPCEKCVDDGFDPAKGEPKWEVIPPDPVDVMLVKCPVWGVDVAPLAIAYLAQSCCEAGLSVRAVDLNVKMHNRHTDRALWNMDRYKAWTTPEEFPETYEALWPLTEHYLKQIAALDAKVIGFSICTSSWLFTRETARRLKVMAPGKVIVYGGPAVTNSLDVELIEADECDYMFFGEADLALPKFVRAILSGGDPGKVGGFLRVGDPIDSAKIETIIVPRNTSYPTPTFEDLNLGDYSTDAVPLLSSRGCIRRCTFCNDHHISRKFRPRKAEDVFSDIEWYVLNFGAHHFTFLDLLINGHIAELEKLCDLIIASRYEIRWGGQGVIRKEMSAEILQKMAKAGCQSFVYGIESFSDKVLKLMNKPYTRELAKRVLTDTHEAGIESIINIVVGFPGEGPEEFAETYNFLRDHRDLIDQVASVSPCLVNLGSELFDTYQDYGIIFTPTDGSVKWYTEDGNTYAERLRRLMAVTELLAGRDKSIHTVNIYDREDREKRIAADQRVRDQVISTGLEINCEKTIGVNQPVSKKEPVDAMIALPPPWGVDFPPLGLSCLAAAVRKEGLSVAVRDLNIECHNACGDYLRTWWEPENLKYWTPGERLGEITAFLVPQVNSLLDEILDRKPRVVGLSTNESNLPFSLRIARKIKDECPEVAVILGGPGVAWPVDRAMLQDASVDGFMPGEGERNFPSLIKALKAGENVDGHPGFEPVGREPVLKPSADDQVKNLDDLAMPLFDDYRLDLYQSREFPLHMSRGCVNRCTFCNDTLITPKYRSHSPERVLETIKVYKERYGAHDFMFCDLLVNADLKSLHRFAELVESEKVRMSWSGQARIDIRMDEKYFELLARSGCASLVFGVESFSDKVLGLMKKGYVAKEAAVVMRRCKNAGIKVIINLIVGFPGEGEKEFFETLGFVRDNNELIDEVSALSSCIITPQCAIEADPEKFDVVLPKPEHWRQWHTTDGENTYEIRAARLLRFIEVLDELGVRHGMTNRYEEMLSKQ
jgi:radical SAM superfamily enzyme YgiQ (UPF0313 family)